MLKSSKFIYPIIFCFVVLMVIGCGTTKQGYTGPQKSESGIAVIVPSAPDYTVDITIEKLDGKTVNVSDLDRLEILPGSHELVIRVDHVPARGTSVVLGGWGNLAARAATTKSMSATVSFQAQESRKYLVTAGLLDDAPAVWIVDETTEQIVASQRL